jgi:site-specific recombinase XerD
MATIHKRRLGSGEVVWELTHGTGRQRQRFVAGRTREEAESVLREFKRQLALHGSAPGDSSLRTIIDEYAEYLRVNRRPRTVIRYLRVLETFAQCFLADRHPDVIRLREIKPQHLEEYKRLRADGRIDSRPGTAEVQRERQLRLDVARNPKRGKNSDNARFGWLGRHSLKAGVAPRTVNYELLVLQTFFRWAIRRNHLFMSPATSIERFRLPRKVLPKFVTSADLTKFFQACTPTERRLFMTILLTGMRKGEAEHLSWEDISFELGVIFIREKPDVGWRPKTDERLIPISPVVHDILTEQLSVRSSERWVFATTSGTRDTHMLEKLKKICRKAHIRATTVHALRHSFGAHLRMAGASLADIADLLGHRDLATTQIYARVQQEHLRQVVAKLTPLVKPDESALENQMSPENVTQTRIGASEPRKLLN